MAHPPSCPDTGRLAGFSVVWSVRHVPGRRWEVSFRPFVIERGDAAHVNL
jgi:hypothetical protein